LIIEKIIKTRIFPMLEQPKMKFLLKLPVINNIIYGKIKSKIIDAFGGNLLELILGGAGVNKEVETFLRRIKFPFTVGYGMTECGPLISYCPWAKQREASCGRIVDRMEVRADSDNPAVTPGVLWVRGANVMLGYYKNDEATDAVMRDGWMNTGDICNVDADGYIYIRGRDKNMILGPSGQNIYPEEIEQVLNNLPYVAESIVVDAGDGKLKALIHPDYDSAEKQGLSRDAVNKLMDDNLAQLNTQMPAYSKVASLKIYEEEFEKTPKRSIKRYLYQGK
jgi:long-chain acyl-CoA synthetase